MNRTSVASARLVTLLLAILFLSPSLLKPLHFVAIHHHYQSWTAEVSIDFTPVHCLVHDFLLFSYVKETSQEFQKPGWNHLVLITDGQTNPKYPKPSHQPETRGPPKIAV